MDNVNLPPVYIGDEPDAVGLGLGKADEDSVSLPVPGQTMQPLPPAVAQTRAKQAEVGVGDKLQKKAPDFYEDFLQGYEKMVRHEAAAKADHEAFTAREKAITDLAVKKGGPLSPQEVMRVVNSFKPADPNDVLERAFADKTLGVLSTAKGYERDSFLDLAKAEMPKQVDDTLAEGSELLTKNLYIRHRMENTEQNLVQNQTWPGYLADAAKNLFQPYVEYKQRGNIGGFFEGIGLGSNLDAASSTLYRMPMDEFKKRFDAAMDYLEKDNPQLAVEYAKSLLGQDTFDASLKNIFTGIMIPDNYALAKGLGKLGGKITTYNQIRKAAKDQVEAAAKDTEVLPQTPHEGAGDLHTAAATKLAEVNKTGNILTKATDTLMSTWWDINKAFKANPGTYLSREAFTRLDDEMIADGVRFFKKVGAMNRVERTPAAVEDPAAVAAYIAKMKQTYKGADSTLLDIEGLYVEPLSNTKWWKYKHGNYDASEFPDLATAQGFAKKQLNLVDPIIEGQPVSKVYVPESLLYRLDAETGKRVPNRLSVETSESGIKVKLFTPEIAKKNRNKQPSALSDTKFVESEVMPSAKPQPGYIGIDVKTGKFDTAVDLSKPQIEQQGLGFHIVRWIPFKETDDLVRDTMIRDTNNKIRPEAISTSSATGGKALMNSVLGGLRTSEETMSFNESVQRKAATYTQSNLQKWAKDLYQDLEDIKSGRNRYDENGRRIPGWRVNARYWTGEKVTRQKIRREFEQALNAGRTMYDENGEPGKFFQNPGELQDYYNRSFNRDPSYLETKAYFNWVKLIEADRAMAEISEFRYRARMGAEQHSVSVLDSSGNTIKSDFFDGTRMDHFPGGDESILILGRTKGEETVKRLDQLLPKELKELKDKTTSGQAKVIEIYDRDHQPLSNFSDVAGDKVISYVYTEGLESKPITFNHVKRRQGGHFEWDYDQYLKQADIRNQDGYNLYLGDKTLMPVKNGKLGGDVAKLINEAQRLIREGKWDEAKPIAAQLGIKWSEFTSWWHPGRDAAGKETRPFLNLYEPIVLVSRNKKISEMGSELMDRYRLAKPDGTGYVETFKDMTKSGPANNFKVAYNQERNSSFDTMRTIDDVGSQGNPIYQYQPAEMIDPLETMNRALNRMINSTFMDDYKIFHVEHWLREAEPYLNAKKNQIRSSPFYYYNNPEYHSATPKHIIANLESNRLKGQTFVGKPNKFDTWVHELTNNLADGFYEKYGPEDKRNLLEKGRSVAPLWALNRLKDPVSFMRAVTFNFKLGLGAIPQVLVQAQTHALIWALEPKHGTVGTYSMLLHGWGKFTDNPKILRHLDDYATKLNGFGSKWRPGEFLEARRELENTGFENVAGEYVNINNQLKTRFILNDFDKGLKIGQYPFRLGEQTTRVTAWYTAFREFRDANPTTPIGNLERSKILQKADLLTVNMSRASASTLNDGVFSLSTQFLSYQIRLAELFWGKRLAGERWGWDGRMAARARIITAYSALYGVPSAIGVTGLPFADNLREHFMDDLGYIPGEKWYSTMLNEGLPAWQIAMITGQLPNVGDRFGSQGFTNVKQFLNGDIPWWQAFGGAATTTTFNFVGSTVDPFYQWTKAWMNNGPEAQFKIKAADLLEPLKEISSISTAAKWWAAINTGKWISKNEQDITDVTPLQAALYGLTGMNPQEQDDMFVRNKMVSGEKDSIKTARKEFIKDWRRMLQAKANGDDEQGNAYARNAFARAKVAGMSDQDINAAIAMGNRTSTNAIDTANANVWKSGDANKRDKRIEYYRRQLKMEDQ